MTFNCICKCAPIIQGIQHHCSGRERGIFIGPQTFHCPNELRRGTHLQCRNQIIGLSSDSRRGNRFHIGKRNLLLRMPHIRFQLFQFRHQRAAVCTNPLDKRTLHRTGKCDTTGFHQGFQPFQSDLFQIERSHFCTANLQFPMHRNPFGETACLRKRIGCNDQVMPLGQWRCLQIFTECCNGIFGRLRLDRFIFYTGQEIGIAQPNHFSPSEKAFGKQRLLRTIQRH